VKRKKQGASLIVVIIVFMFLTTVSTAMLSMVLVNYKARVSESKRVENLYASDSGLEVAYNVIGKNFDAAVRYGYYKVDTLKKGSNTGTNNPNYIALNTDMDKLNGDIVDLNKAISTAVSKLDSNTNVSDLENQIAKKNALIKEDEELQQVLINEEFKRAFNNFIKKIDVNANAAENIPSNQLETLIEGHSYIDMSEVNDKNDDTNIDSNEYKPEYVVDFGIQNGASPTFMPVTVSKNVSGTSSKPTGIDASNGHHETVNFNISPVQQYYDIAVTSSFYSEKLTGSQDNSSKTNERQLQANFKLSVPEFQDVYYQANDGYIEQYLATKDRAITVNGNMNLSGVNGFSVNNGEIYVGGTTPSGVTVSNRSYEKYSGGIMVYNSDNVNFGQDVVTRNTFNLRSGAKVTIVGNLYGSNVYVGGSTYDSSDINNINLNQSANSAALSVNKVVIDNDLGLKATSSNVTINDFFGINDKNITQVGNPTDAYGHQVDRTKSSSSIIVNSNDDSSNIIIKKSAYIMGTAHINTNETATDSSNEYQTGESGAVKGNYIAYTVPLDATESLAYYNPLQLVNSPDVITKATHFLNYWSAKIKGGNYPYTGGLQLPIIENADGSVDKIKSNVHTIGALVFERKNGNGKVVERNVVDSTYNLNLEIPGGPIYNAQAEFASKVYRFNQSATKEYDYNKTQLTDFTSLVDTSQISSPVYNLSGEYAIFNGETGKEIKIMEATDGVEQIVPKVDSIEIHVSNKGTVIAPKYNLNGVIVSAGNVSIDSNITINGCLIAGGDLNINGGQNITINYDSGVIERVQAKNKDIFKAVFGNIVVDDTNNENPADSSTSNNTASASYDLKYFLEKKIWRILK